MYIGTDTYISHLYMYGHTHTWDMPGHICDIYVRHITQNMQQIAIYITHTIYIHYPYTFAHTVWYIGSSPKFSGRSDFKINPFTEQSE